MTPEQFKEYKSAASLETAISVEDLKGIPEGTLLWGVMGSGTTLHIYLADGKIHRVVYYGFPHLNNLELIEAESSSFITVEDCQPRRRICPKRTNFEFVILLKRLGGFIRFLPYDEVEVEQEAFYGAVLEDFSEANQP
ncbi:hypothetical protein [Neptuniibacter sp. QD37_11]|uniref:hypothetical protein n=1 Tax=Neptuniibacter sp. QD37_11 TaxID=3398209 RepID=UPI0039F54E8F